LIADRTNIAVNINKLVTKNVDILKPKERDGNVLKSLFYTWYLAFPVSVVYNYTRMRSTDFRTLIGKPDFASNIYSCQEIKRRTMRIYKSLHMKLKEPKKFTEYIVKFDPVDSQRLFLSFSTIVRGIMQFGD